MRGLLRKPRRLALVFGLVLTIAALSAIASPVAFAASQPNITVAIPAASTGNQVETTGSGFTPGGLVAAVVWDSQLHLTGLRFTIASKTDGTFDLTEAVKGCDQTDYVAVYDFGAKLWSNATAIHVDCQPAS